MWLQIPQTNLMESKGQRRRERRKYLGCFQMGRQEWVAEKRGKSKNRTRNTKPRCPHLPVMKKGARRSLWFLSKGVDTETLCLPQSQKMVLNTEFPSPESLFEKEPQRYAIQSNPLILHRRKMNLSEVIWLAQGHTAALSELVQKQHRRDGPSCSI